MHNLIIYLKFSVSIFGVLLLAQRALCLSQLNSSEDASNQSPNFGLTTATPNDILGENSTSKYPSAPSSLTIEAPLLNSFGSTISSLQNNVETTTTTLPPPLITTTTASIDESDDDYRNNVYLENSIIATTQTTTTVEPDARLVFSRDNDYDSRLNQAHATTFDGDIMQKAESQLNATRLVDDNQIGEPASIVLAAPPYLDAQSKPDFLLKRSDHHQNTSTSSSPATRLPPLMSATAYHEPRVYKHMKSPMTQEEARLANLIQIIKQQASHTVDNNDNRTVISTVHGSAPIATNKIIKTKSEPNSSWNTRQPLHQLVGFPTLVAENELKRAKHNYNDANEDNKNDDRDDKQTSESKTKSSNEDPTAKPNNTTRSQVVPPPYIANFDDMHDDEVSNDGKNRNKGAAQRASDELAMRLTLANGKQQLATDLIKQKLAGIILQLQRDANLQPRGDSSDQHLQHSSDEYRLPIEVSQSSRQRGRQTGEQQATSRAQNKPPPPAPLQSPLQTQHQTRKPQRLQQQPQSTRPPKSRLIHIGEQPSDKNSLPVSRQVRRPLLAPSNVRSVVASVSNNQLSSKPSSANQSQEVAGKVESDKQTPSIALPLQHQQPHLQQIKLSRPATPLSGSHRAHFFSNQQPALSGEGDQSLLDELLLLRAATAAATPTTSAVSATDSSSFFSSLDKPSSLFWTEDGADDLTAPTTSDMLDFGAIEGPASHSSPPVVDSSTLRLQATMADASAANKLHQNVHLFNLHRQPALPSPARALPVTTPFQDTSNSDLATHYLRYPPSSSLSSSPFPPETSAEQMMKYRLAISSLKGLANEPTTAMILSSLLANIAQQQQSQQQTQLAVQQQQPPLSLSSLPFLLKQQQLSYSASQQEPNDLDSIVASPSEVAKALSNNSMGLIVSDLAQKWALSQVPNLEPIPLAATVPAYLIKLPNGQILAAALTNAISIQGVQKGAFGANGSGYRARIARKLRAALRNSSSGGRNSPKQQHHHQQGKYLTDSTTTTGQLATASSQQLLTAVKPPAEASFARDVLDKLGFKIISQPSPIVSIGQLQKPAAAASKHWPSPTTKESYGKHKTDGDSASEFAQLLDLNNLSSLPLASLDEPVFSFVDESQLIDAESFSPQLASSNNQALSLPTAQIQLQQLENVNEGDDDAFKAKLRQLLAASSSNELPPVDDGVLPNAEWLKKMDKQPWPQQQEPLADLTLEKLLSSQQQNLSDASQQKLSKADLATAATDKDLKLTEVLGREFAYLVRPNPPKPPRSRITLRDVFKLNQLIQLHSQHLQTNIPPHMQRNEQSLKQPSTNPSKNLLYHYNKHRQQQPIGEWLWKTAREMLRNYGRRRLLADPNWYSNFVAQVLVGSMISPVLTNLSPLRIGAGGRGDSGSGGDYRRAISSILATDRKKSTTLDRFATAAGSHGPTSRSRVMSLIKNSLNLTGGAKV